ncbi:hypothetical protein BO78DRAFT_324785 [Aspergillus sclerotiicarbonarius CBS 121057]|uniref:Zn(2)-C6 fungal-type domain-containing protein n=1 Tax=Aspergillus sclerotiicarbonarius (strain CBS 121057 / IBT 28362) TaxID=1448318 RepID=A0A319DXW6_ASPSB|nr:hypothetical protein BO78DRAFT_324785 [Aspergillus sclerotiicarbonarius CBS 121057]
MSSSSNEAFHARRPHKKSRNGCKLCKARRVKAYGQCDEKKPSCSSCSLRETTCEYSSTSSSTPRNGREQDTNPAQALSHFGSFGGNPKRQLDIQLMHYYTVSTVSSLRSMFHLTAPVFETLQMDAPKLAFQHEFLMDNLLLLALVHMRSVDMPSGDALPITIYRGKALHSFRRAITNMSPNETQAVILTSFLLAISSIPTDRITQEPQLWTLNWMRLANGPRSLLKQMKRSSRLSPIRSLDRDQVMGDFVNHPVPIGIPVGLSAALTEVANHHEQARNSILYRAASCIGKLFGILTLPDAAACINFKVRAWPFMLPPEFMDLVAEADPCALLIIAYYLPLLQFLPQGWLFENLAAQEMHKIARSLDSNWSKYMLVPQAALTFTAKADLKTFLINQIPVESLASGDNHEPFFSSKRC